MGLPMMMVFNDACRLQVAMGQQGGFGCAGGSGSEIQGGLIRYPDFQLRILSGLVPGQVGIVDCVPGLLILRSDIYVRAHHFIQFGFDSADALDEFRTEDYHLGFR